MNKVGELMPGAIDVVGDVHGEIDALLSLIKHLGYDSEGRHQQNRHLVFLGDLTDRGPDSPAVLNYVSELISRGVAQGLMGNHELNLLRHSKKEGNGWYFENNHDHEEGKFLDSKGLDPARIPSIERFLSRLPLVLERDDLRLVHAAWHDPSISWIRKSPLSTVELYDAHHEIAVQLGKDTGLFELARKDKGNAVDTLSDATASVPMLHSAAALDALYQDSNPVRLITSGVERVARQPFYASGKWRFVDRTPWWETYKSEVPVIMGHYWRWPSREARESHSRGETDLFQLRRANEWLGPLRNVFCVDFAVGARHKERGSGVVSSFKCRLGAMRWPERELTFDDGEFMSSV
jgi:hypothetical protein